MDSEAVAITSPDDTSPADASPSGAASHFREAEEGVLSGCEATYSPEDNKLRLRSLARLDRATYERVHAAGFRWAGKQQLFVAPAWSPEREDLLVELCGGIGDEDTTLVERAGERAERFSGYGERRAGEAESARQAVSAVADNIPLGQPILVGHHSERRARRDAERIQNGMRKAVRLWETSEYWTRRAAGALRNAKYKELPAVRHRRIKGLESELRKVTKRIEEGERFIRAWSRPGLTVELARQIANYDHIRVDVEGKQYGSTLWEELVHGGMAAAPAAKVAIAVHERQIEVGRRWVGHLNNRLGYERAILADAGGLPADRFEIEVGGRVLVGREWAVVLRVIRKDGRIVSLRTNARFVGLRGIEEVSDYRPPVGDEAARVKAATERPPMCNYPGPGFKPMTAAEWAKTYKDYKGSRELGIGAGRVERGSGRMDPRPAENVVAPAGRHRVRTVVAGGALVPVYISDRKRVDPPPPPAATVDTTIPAPALLPRVLSSPGPRRDGSAFEALRGQLHEGVKVISAPQLFPTPAPLAARMVGLAEIADGDAVLEPSAGTGNILRAVAEGGARCSTVAVELNAALAEQLRSTNLPGITIRHADFLECSADDLGTFDRIVMNPPFAHGEDVKHILHARGLLRAGGRLVAIAANGPRQAATLRPLVDDCGGVWEELPDDTFAGTSVRAVLLTLGRGA